MKMYSEVEIRGCEPKVSKKGNDYNVVSFEQGVDTVTCITSIPLNDLKALKGTTCKCEFDFNPQYKQLALVGYEDLN